MEKGWEEIDGVITKGSWVSFWEDKNVLKRLGDGLQNSMNTLKVHLIAHFKWLNCMAFELYLGKAV